MTIHPDQLAACRAEAKHLLAAAEHVLPVSNSAAAVLASLGRELVATGLGAPDRGHGARISMGLQAAAYVSDADRVVDLGQPVSSATTTEGLKAVTLSMQQVGLTPPGDQHLLAQDRERFLYVEYVDGAWRRPSMSVSRPQAEEEIRLLRDAVRRPDL